MEENTMLEQTDRARETTQTQEFGEDFFLEEDAGSLPEEQAQKEEMEPVSDPQPPETIKIKYDHNQVEVTPEQLHEYAQKGMNYDRVKEELEALRQERQQNIQYQQVISQFAADAGMTPTEYLSALERQREERRVYEETQKGVPEEVARRLITLESKENQRQQQEQAFRRQQAQRQQYVQLAKEYPGLKEFPQEVIRMINEGIPPLHAYRTYENSQLKQKLAVYEKNQENRRKTPGSAMGEVPGEDQDEFMSGFGSVFQ